MIVEAISYREAVGLFVRNHYLHRRPNVVFSFGLVSDGEIKGVITFGIPASRDAQIGACPSSPNEVIELNRLWVCGSMPRNSETWFIAKEFNKMPPFIVISYADTSEGHMGYVYLAANFRYAGWTDMDRKTPRFDYVVPGKHSRDAFRDGGPKFTERVRRKPKVRYWTTTGNRRERYSLERKCEWPSLDWKVIPSPVEHKTLRAVVGGNG